MNRRLPARSGPRTVAALAILLAVFAGPLTAQPRADLAAMLVRQTYTHIRDYALHTLDQLTLLHHAMVAAQQAFIAPAGADRPEPPRLSGDEGDDLEATAGYVQALADASPRPDAVAGAAMRGMIGAIGDQSGAAFAPAEFTRYVREDLRCEHPGIGVQVDRVQGEVVVVDVTAGGPAARAGMRLGDVLLEVGGLPVSERPPDDVIDLLRGPQGSRIEVALRRDGTLMRRSLVRESVREVPTRWSMRDRRIGYLRLIEFCIGAAGDLQRAVGTLEKSGAGALLLDLRNNGGGLVDEAVTIASLFLQSGRIAVEERRHEQVALIVVQVDRRFAGQVVVLVNEFSASASEIVAGALQDSGTPLVGQRTFGKATVQTVYPLEGGWGLRLTTARYLTRAGRAIDGIGLRPDVPIPMAIDRVEGPLDAQRGEALSFLQARLAAGGEGR